MKKIEPNARTVNRADLALIFGRSLPTIDAWVRRGCPFIEKGGKGKEWRFDSAAVHNWLVAQAVEEAVSQFADVESGQVSKEEADRRRAVALAITAEVDAAEALDEVVSRQDAEADLAAFCLALKNGLATACAKIASRAASMGNAAEIQELCVDEINRAYGAAEAELSRRWLSDVDSGENQPA